MSALSMALGACGDGGGGPGDAVGDEPLIEEPGAQSPGGGNTEIATGGDGSDDNRDPSAATEEPRKDEKGKEEEKKVCLPPTAVAIEGQRVPDTHYQRFDPAIDDSDYGFRDPKTNEHGNVAFRATYGMLSSVPVLNSSSRYDGPGAGIFGWSRKHDKLLSIAKTGDWTRAGPLPSGLFNYTGPVLNDHNLVAFSVRNIYGENGAPSVGGEPAEVGTEVSRIPREASAVFQAYPKDEGCRDFKLKVIAKTGDCVPRGGYFEEFFGVDQNDKGDVAFIARYGSGNDVPMATATETDPELQAELGASFVPAPPPNGPGFGVFLKRHDKDGHDRYEDKHDGGGDPTLSALRGRDHCDRCDELEVVVRSGDYLKGTRGGRLCSFTTTVDTQQNDLDEAIEGPWMNNHGDVLFIANCITGRPDLEGSLFIRRKGEHKPELFVAIGDRGPKGGYISDIGLGHPGVNEEDASMMIEVDYLNGCSNSNSGLGTSGYNGHCPPSVFVVTKELDDDHGDCDDLEVCAYDGQKLTRKYQLSLEVEHETVPTIDSTGLIAFSGEAVLKGMPNLAPVPEVAELVTLEAAAPSQEELRYELPAEVAVIFTCKDRDLDAAVVQFDRKPVDWKDIWWSPAMVDQAKALSSSSDRHWKPKFVFGEIENQSNDDDFVTFVDFTETLVTGTTGDAAALHGGRFPLFPPGFPTGVFITGTEED